LDTESKLRIAEAEEFERELKALEREIAELKGNPLPPTVDPDSMDISVQLPELTKEDLEGPLTFDADAAHEISHLRSLLTAKISQLEKESTIRSQEAEENAAEEKRLSEELSRLGRMNDDVSKLLKEMKKEVKVQREKALRKKAEERKNAKKKRVPKEKKEKVPIVLTPQEEEFMKKATEVKLTIDNVEYVAKPKVFSTGSFGWSLGGKVLHVQVEDQDLKAQVSLNLPIRGTRTKE